MAAAFGKAWITARKPHRCIWCDGKIHRGEVYGSNTYVDGGVYGLQRWHVDCWFDSWQVLDHFEEFQPGEFERPAHEPYTRTIDCYQ